MSYDPDWNKIKQPVAGGDLVGTYPNVTLAPLSVSPAGTYGSGTEIPRIVVDDKGRVVSATEEPVAFPDLVPNPSGVYGDGTQVPVITVDSKGRVVSVSTAPIVAGNPSFSVIEYLLSYSLPAVVPVGADVLVFTIDDAVSPTSVFSAALDFSAAQPDRVYHLVYNTAWSSAAHGYPVPLRLTPSLQVLGLPGVDLSPGTSSIVLWPGTRVSLLYTGSALVCVGHSFETGWRVIPSSMVSSYFSLVRSSDLAQVMPASWDAREVHWRCRAAAVDFRYRFRWSGGAVSDTASANEMYLWRAPPAVETWFSSSVLSPAVVPVSLAYPLFIATNDAPTGHVQNLEWVTTGHGTGGHGLLYPHLTAWAEASITRYGYILTCQVYHATHGWMRIHAYGTRLDGFPCPLGVHDTVEGSFIASIWYHVT